ncbi:MAG TPA: hypothetical protein VGE85_03440 [Terracidiphilus sp.]
MHHILKPTPIDRHQPTVGPRNDRCAARLVIDERQLTDNVRNPRPYCRTAGATAKAIRKTIKITATTDSHANE